MHRRGRVIVRVERCVLEIVRRRPFHTSDRLYRSYIYNIDHIYHRDHIEHLDHTDHIDHTRCRSSIIYPKVPS